MSEGTVDTKEIYAYTFQLGNKKYGFTNEVLVHEKQWKGLIHKLKSLTEELEKKIVGKK